jgi:PhnB protein
VTWGAREASLSRMENDLTLPRLVPLLVVRDAARAIDFYVDVLGAKVVARFLDARRTTISHADLSLGDAAFAVTEEAPRWNSNAPPSLGGSPVVLMLRVADVEVRVEAMLRAGANVVFPLQDFCGERMARLCDPFGHIWILSQRIEDLSVDEIQKRRDELAAKAARGHPEKRARS